MQALRLLSRACVRTDSVGRRHGYIGPLIGALIRPFGGWLSDKVCNVVVTEKYARCVCVCACMRACACAGNIHIYIIQVGGALVTQIDLAVMIASTIGVAIVVGQVRHVNVSCI